MKKIIFAIFFVLLFTACKREPIKTETRVYELTFIDGKTFVYKFNNVDVNAEDGIDHSRGGYFFYIFSHKTYEHVEAVIRFKKSKIKRMDKLEYIPGDLVMTNGVPLGTAKDVVYRVTSSDPSKTLKLDDGTVLKGVVRLENLEGAKFGDKGYLLGDSGAWIKDIVPINLVPAILEKNGWNKSISWFYAGSEERGYQFSKELDDKWDELDRMTYGDLQISQCENLRDWNYINECNHNFRFEFTYVHELQHLLYALHIDSNLKI